MSRQRCKIAAYSPSSLVRNRIDVLGARPPLDMQKFAIEHCESDSNLHRENDPNLPPGHHETKLAVCGARPTRLAGRSESFETA